MEISNAEINSLIEELELDQASIDRYIEEADSAQEKIFTKYKEATENEYYGRRWLWELIQNALDSSNSDEKVDITMRSIINTESSSFIFEHNGGPFMPPKEWNKRHEFKNFILAKSGKYNDDDKIGKFGTGFLSTHCLSDIIKVEGKCVDDNGNVTFREITLDRSDFKKEDPISIQKRTLKIIKSLLDYETLAKTESSDSFSIRLSYLNIASSKMLEGLHELVKTIPFIFSLNNKLGTIKYIDSQNRSYEWNSEKVTSAGLPDGFKIYKSRYKYSKDKEAITKTVILLLGQRSQLLWTLKANGINKLESIRQEYKDDVEIPMHSLFCQFPLIGSHDFKFPLLINSKDFRPEEKRHGINLKEENTTNKEILEESKKLFEQFLDFASKQYKGIYNIIDTKYETNLPSWIDKNWYTNYIEEIRLIIQSKPIIDIDNQVSNRKPIKKSDGKPGVYFPCEANNKSDLNLKLYDLIKALNFYPIPLREDLEHWNKNLWQEKKVVKRIDTKEFISDLVENLSWDTLIERLGNEEVVYNWLKSLYSFILIDLEEVALLDSYNSNLQVGIILTQGKNFRKLSQLKLGEVDREIKAIDNELIEIHELFHEDAIPLSDKIIHSNYNFLIEDKATSISEDEVSKEIKIKCEDLIKIHDQLAKDIHAEEDQEKIKKKKEIESKLSKLQNWISTKNSEKEYFDNYLKRKILQAIIDEKKSIHLTKLLELDRNGKVTMERQHEILSDADLDEKLKLGKLFLEMKRKKEEVDKQNRNIGNHFEKLFQEMVEEISIPIIKRDGPQDFILYPNTNHEVYVELKSTSKERGNVKLSPEQLFKAISQNSRYYVCIIPFEGDAFETNRDKFKMQARFINDLEKNLKIKREQVVAFLSIEEGVSGSLPDKSLLEEIKEKEYKVSILKELWGQKQFESFIQEVKDIKPR